MINENDFKKLFYFKPFKKFILKTKGLKNDQLKNFLE